MQGPNQWMFTGKKIDLSDDSPIVQKGMRVLKFFASLRLAVVIILALMIAMAVGTFIEAAEGTQAAVLIVYDSPWFHAILILLGLNVFTVMVDRIPWQKKHIGFLVTHAGIILILVGSFITRQTMVDGQVTLAEGETSSHVTLLQKPLVYIFDHSSQKDWIFPIRPKPFAWEGHETLASEKPSQDISVTLMNYYPKARIEEKRVAAESGPSALKLQLQNDFVNQELWLVEDDANDGRVSMGPAVFSFSKTKLEESLELKNVESFIEFVFSDKTVQIPVNLKQAFPQQFALEGTPYEITINRHLKNAAVVGKDLVDQAGSDVSDDPETWLNPALELTLRGPDFEEGHTTFAKYPEFPTVHGLKPSAAGVKVFYRLAYLQQPKTANELRLIKDNTGQLTYQIKDKNGLRGAALKPGETYETGWMNLKFTVEEFFPASKVQKKFNPLHNLSESTDAVNAVQITIQNEDQEASVWLTQGVRESISLNGKRYEFIYGYKRIPMGFKIQLKDFQIKHNPGTESPASFSSDVVLRDDMKGITKDVHISMNEPLEHRGFKVYQAAYSLVPGEPEISIFSVGHDPGIPVKYTGALLIVIGATIMFAMRKFSKPRKK